MEERPARLANARQILARLWRRVIHCRRDQHRDAIGCAFGLLEWRCVDCGSVRVLGFVFRASNKLHPHFPWERTDDV